jgi:hypothetical protein
MLGEVFVRGVMTVVGKFLGNGNEADERKKQLESELIALFETQIKGQLKVNEKEAAHRSVFVAGWRPFIGWVCGVSIAYTYIFRPIATDVAAFYGRHLFLTELDSGALMALVTGMLGLGGMRTYEKWRGVSK